MSREFGLQIEVRHGVKRRIRVKEGTFNSPFITIKRQAHFISNDIVMASKFVWFN